MALQTITGTEKGITGKPVPYARATIKLSANSHDADAQYSAKEVPVVADASGIYRFKLWPNATGAVSTYYTFTYSNGSSFDFVLLDDADPEKVWTLSELEESYLAPSSPDYPHVISHVESYIDSMLGDPDGWEEGDLLVGSSTARTLQRLARPLVAAVLLATALTGPEWAQISDAHVAADAAIAFSKLEATPATAAALLAHANNTGNPHQVTAAQAGAPTIAAVNDALALKANLAGAAFTGAISTTGTLSAASDTDATTILGRARIHSPSTDHATFSHFDQSGVTAYALRQNAAGTTIVNAATGQTVGVAVNNSVLFTVAAASATVASNVKLMISDSATRAIGRVNDGGSLWLTGGSPATTVSGYLALYGSTASPANTLIWHDATTERLRISAGAFTLTGTVAITSDLNVNAGKFIVTGSSGAFTAAGAATLGGGITFTSGSPQIGTSTLNGADTARLILASADTASTSRGAFITVHGNQYATDPGKIILAAGSTGEAVGAAVKVVGAFEVTDTTTLSGALTVQGLTIGLGGGAGASNTAFGNAAFAAGAAGSIQNVAIGYQVLTLNNSGDRNTGLGYQALSGNVSTSDNTAIGYRALFISNGADRNTGVGASALLGLTSGDDNTAVGEGALAAVTSLSQNTAVGSGALGLTVGARNVALGYFAGRYETGSDSFYVDNRNRTNTAGDKAGALLYGTFNATPSAQTLAINAAVTIPYALAIGNTVAAAAGIASTHKVTMEIGGVTYYLLASNV